MPSALGTIDLLPTPAQRRQLSEICARNRITWLAVFGSVARGEARPESDVDLLATYADGTVVTYLDLARIAEELSPLFDNRPVDLGKPSQLHWYIRDRVLREARVLYGEG